MNEVALRPVEEADLLEQMPDLESACPAACDVDSRG
jgi:hypothetical protein